MMTKYLQFEYCYKMLETLSQEIARCDFHLKEKLGDIEWMSRKGKIQNDVDIITKYLQKLSREINFEIEAQTKEQFKFIINRDN